MGAIQRRFSITHYGRDGKRVAGREREREKIGFAMLLCATPRCTPSTSTLVEFYELINKRQEAGAGGRDKRARLKLQPFCQLLLLLLLELLIMWIIRGICLAARTNSCVRSLSPKSDVCVYVCVWVCLAVCCFLLPAASINDINKKICQGFATG